SPVIRVSVATIFADSMRQTAATVRSVRERAVAASEVWDMSATCALGFLAPARLLLDPLVVGGEVVQLRHAAHLEEGAGSERRPLGPLLRLLAGGHLDDPEAVEQLLGLAIGAVGDQRRLCGEVDDEPLLGVGQTLAGDEHA